MWRRKAGFPHFTFPRRPLIGAPGLWQIYELPQPNVGDYSPTEVVIATSAPDMAAAMRKRDFRFHQGGRALRKRSRRGWSRRATCGSSLIHGGFHLSGRSNGTSLVVLPAALLALSARARRTCPHRARRSADGRRDLFRRGRYRHPVRLRHPHPGLPARRPRGHAASANEHRFRACRIWPAIACSWIGMVASRNFGRPCMPSNSDGRSSWPIGACWRTREHAIWRAPRRGRA